MTAVLQKTAAPHRFSSASYLEGLLAELDRAHISRRLQQSRVAAGLSQDEMADTLHVHVNSVQNWESVKKPTVPFDRLDEWAAITGTSKTWLLHGEEVTPPDESLAELVQEMRRELAEIRQILLDRPNSHA